MEIARRELLRNVILGGAALAVPKGLQFLEPLTPKKPLLTSDYCIEVRELNNYTEFTRNGFVQEFEDSSEAIVPFFFESPSKYRFLAGQRDIAVFIPRLNDSGFDLSSNHPLARDVKETINSCYREYGSRIYAVIGILKRTCGTYRYGVVASPNRPIMDKPLVYLDIINAGV